MEIIQARVARQAFSLQDVDPLVPVEPPAIPEAVAAGAGDQQKKKVKMSAAVGQLDQTEVELISPSELEVCYRCYREAVGANSRTGQGSSGEGGEQRRAASR